MLTDVISLWERLKLESRATGDYLERLVRPDTEVDLVLGMGPDRCNLKVSGEFPIDWHKRISTPNCMNCRLSSPQKLRTLTLELRDSNVEEIFIWFSQDVANRLQNCSAKQVGAVLEATLSQWSEAFKLQSNRGMSREAQQGLFAELFYLEAVLLKEHPKAGVLAWHSQNSIHDFQIGGRAWEVKSYGGRRPEVKISNELQLDTAGLDGLILAVVALKISEEAGTSVEEIASRLINDFRMEKDELMLFKTGLAKYGFIDKTSITKKYLFSPKSISEYLITDDFPRITRDLIPSAIHSINYTLSLGSLESLLAKPVTKY